MKKNDPMPKQQNKKEAKRVHNLIIVDESVDVRHPQAGLRRYERDPPDRSSDAEEVP